MLKKKNRELSRMYTDGDSARACVDVIPRERPLAFFVECAKRSEREWMGGDDHA